MFTWWEGFLKTSRVEKWVGKSRVSASSWMNDNSTVLGIMKRSVSTVIYSVAEYLQKGLFNRVLELGATVCHEVLDFVCF